MTVRDPETLAWAVLSSVPGVGPVSFARLVDHLGSARAVLETAVRPDGPATLVEVTVGPDGGHPTLVADAAAAIAAATSMTAAVAATLDRLDLRVVTLRDAAYPRRLRVVDLPPPVLFVLGDPGALEAARAVALVGTRRPTAAGRTFAGRAAEAVALLGATVVSGLAYGIDAAAHAAAVRARRPTVAVIGGGHARLYPAAHRSLVRGIVATGGAVVSEFGPELEPSRGTFPRRNRIISGLADATVVIEAGERSGALTTATWALEQGRSLHVVPGRPGDPAVAGSLALLRDVPGEARIVTDLPALLADLELVEAGAVGDRTARATIGASLAGLGAAEQAVAAALAIGRETVDELARATGFATATVLGALTLLETRGLVVDVFGRYRPAGVLAAGPPGLGGGPRVAARRAREPVPP